MSLERNRDFQVADSDAARLSRNFPGRVFRVYLLKCPNRDLFWVRNDPEPIADVDGRNLRLVSSWLDGIHVRP